MWFFGAVFLSTFPAFSKDVLHGDEQVASLLLVVFSVGIAIGSLLCETLSRRHVEIGLVPLGAIGMTLFSLDLYFSVRSLPVVEMQSIGVFAAAPRHWRVLFDLGMLALSAGLYSVPMYALIQMRSQPSHRARIIAANNILNAIFMIASSVIAGLLLGAGFSIPEIFMLLAIANAIVAFYIFMLVPEYLLRFIAFVVSRLIYRFKVQGDHNIPVSGAAVVVSNHVSFMDAVLIMAASPRPIRFIMDHRIFATPVLGTVFRLAKAIPIAPRSEDPHTYEAAFATARQVLDEGDLLGIFPEGSITRDGELQPFKGGVLKILQANPVPVVPIGLSNLWGSFFSRIEQGRAMVKPFRRGSFCRVTLRAGPPIAPQDATLELMREWVDLLEHQPEAARVR
jgi:1-acyl-sn-glycerol-3-phosphate acyltransferase